MAQVSGLNKVQVTEEDKRKVMGEAYADPCFFLRFFLPHLFPTEIPWFHRGLIAIATKKTDFLLKYGELDKIVKHFVWREDPNPNVTCKEIPLFELVKDAAGNVTAINLICQQNMACMMPRGFSKTTLLGIGLALYEILFKVHDFLVFLSETGAMAEIQLTNVRRELESNKWIHSVFGILKPEDKSGLKWTATHIETTTGVVAISKGRGGQVRGLNVRGMRPKRIFIDDVEDKESVSTPEQRDKTLDWLYSDVVPALQELDPTVGIMMLGTLLHSEAMLMKVMRDPTWTSVRLACIDKDGDPLWPLVMPHSKIQAKRTSYKLQGKINTFNMEYMSQITNEEDSMFSRRKFKYQFCNREDCAGVALALDPAISSDKKACASSIAVVGMRQNGKLNIMDFWSKVGASPREQIDKFFELYSQYKCTVTGVESNAYQAALVHIMEEEMARKKVYFEINKIMHYQKKEERIEGILQPRYAAGYIEHSRIFPVYEAQLLDYPNGLVDGPDVVSMAIALLDPYSANAGNDGDEDTVGGDEGQDLEELMDGEWRPY